ncbi:MAG: YceD family protein [Bacillota bacterium]
MNIDLSWLKLHPKDTEEFHLEKTYENVEIQKGAHLKDEVVVDLEVTNTGRLMVGKGKIKGNLELQCDRCLNPFQQQVEIPFTVEFCSEENRAYFKNDETFVYFSEPQVDIEPVILENILLSLPLRTLCSPECKGLCSICGQDLNLAECHCQEKEMDPRWEVLKKML